MQVSWESPQLTDEDVRNFLFGQEDHLCLYGLDFSRRIAAQGLQVRRYSHQENLADFDAKKHGVNLFEDRILAFKVLRWVVNFVKAFAIIKS